MSLISSIIGSVQTSKAVGAQVNAGNQAIDTTKSAVANAQSGVNNAVGSANDTLSGVYGQEQGNLSPYLAAGQQGITSLASMLQPGGDLTKQFSFDPSNLTQDPGYQFQLQQGDQAASRQAAATGNAQSGNLQTALAQYNQGLAGTTFNNAYNRALTTFQTNRQNTLQPLNTLIGAGQNATGQFNSAAQNFGNTTSTNDLTGGIYNANAGLNGAKSISDLLLGIGDAKAGGSIAQGNIWGNYAGGASGGLGSMAQNSIGGGAGQILGAVAGI